MKHDIENEVRKSIKYNHDLQHLAHSKLTGTKAEIDELNSFKSWFDDIEPFNERMAILNTQYAKDKSWYDTITSHLNEFRRRYSILLGVENE